MLPKGQNKKLSWFAKSGLPLRDHRGFSLVELMVVVALMGTALALAYQYFFFGQSTWTRADAQSRVLQEAQLVLDKMGGEVRQARKSLEADRAVVRTSATQVKIYTDLPGTADSRPELVIYRKNSSVLQRGYAAPSGTAYPYTYGTINNWVTVVSRVDNADIFTLDTSGQTETLNVNLLVNDTQNPLSSPLKAEVMLAVRNRGNAP